jgi:hypothetical protein
MYNETYLAISLHCWRKNIVFYSRIMAITRSPGARDTKSYSRVIAIIIRPLNNILCIKKYKKKICYTVYDWFTNL